MRYMSFLWLRKNFFSFQALWTVDDNEFKIGHEKIGTFANVKILLHIGFLNSMEAYLFSRVSFHLTNINFSFNEGNTYLTL